jgi:hypothetical protein
VSHRRRPIAEGADAKGGFPAALVFPSLAAGFATRLEWWYQLYHLQGRSRGRIRRLAAIVNVLRAPTLRWGRLLPDFDPGPAVQLALHDLDENEVITEAFELPRATLDDRTFAVCAPDQGIRISAHRSSARRGFSARVEIERGRLAINLEAVARKGAARFGPGAMVDNVVFAAGYVSATDLRLRGEARIGGERVQLDPARCYAWWDHQWLETAELAMRHVRWSWFALHLADDTEVLAYRVGSHRDPQCWRDSAWRICRARGDARVSLLDRPRIEEVAWVESTGREGHKVPTAWRLAISSVGVDLELRQLLPAPWLPVRTGILGGRYLDGPCRAQGRAPAPVLAAWAQHGDARSFGVV